MNVLDYEVEPLVDCVDTDMNVVAFIRATTMIRHRDAVKDFLACGMYPFSAGFGFKGVTDGTTTVLKVVVPLLVFPVESVSVENTHHFLAKVEVDAERILGSYGPKEHEACIAVKLPNGGRLNRVFEQMGVAYALHPLPGIHVVATARKLTPRGRWLR
jgi:hypothetical protein